MESVSAGSSLENALSKGPKDCSTPKERQERSAVSVLKESTNGNSVSLKREENKPKVKILFDKTSTSSAHSMKIYLDHNTCDDGHGVKCSRSVQTEDSLLESYLQKKRIQHLNLSTDSGLLSDSCDPEAYDLMVNESIPENYWKDIAEQRRKALNDTLEENEKLSFEVEQLKEENRRLSDIASKAEHLEKILQEALSDDKEPDDECSAEKCESTEQLDGNVADKPATSRETDEENQCSNA